MTVTAIVVEDGTGLSNSNSYVSVSDATDLLAEINVTTAWTGLSSAAQTGYLIRATSVIDTQFVFFGSLLVLTQQFTQALAFPRYGLFDTDARSITGLPRNLLEATAELAYFLSTQDVISDAAGREADLVKVGPVQVTISAQGRIKKLVPDSVIQKLSRYGRYIYQGRGFRRLAW